MHSTRSRTLAAVAVATLLLAPLAGCGSDDKGGHAEAKSSASPSTSATDTVTDAATGAGTGGAAAPGERLTTDNLVATLLAAMRTEKTAHMTMEIGTSVGAEADVRYSGDRTDMKLSMDMGPTKAVVILVDGTMYMQQSAGGKFVKIDRSDPAMGNLLDQLSSFGPESSVSAMRGAVRDVRYVGADTLDGSKVDKYSVTVDSSSLAKTLGSGAAGTNLPKTVTYDLYVDHDHLMRRIDMSVAGQDVTMKVSRWGEPVDISAPPASQVMTR